MMTKAQWEQLADKEVTVKFKYEESPCRLGAFIGHGGAGAVYDFPDFVWGEGAWVLKVLDPESTVAEQELKSIRNYRNVMRYSDLSLMKFTSWEGVLTYKSQHYRCYPMRKGSTLKKAIKDGEPQLQDLSFVMRLTAHLVRGIAALKQAGLSHGDIKPDNILLMKYAEIVLPMFNDYGTVSDRMTSARSISYDCGKSEYKPKDLLEERIAYDLHCLYRTICAIYGVVDDDVSVIPQPLDRILRTMRNPGKKAFWRLNELMQLLQNENFEISISFYLDSVPRYPLESLPFETVMQCGEYPILRDFNADAEEGFDPLLLMKIPAGRYETVCDVLLSFECLRDFVMPIARCFGSDGSEYVLVHAPDDRRKVFSRPGRNAKWNNELIQDPDGEPCTLEDAEYDSMMDKMDFFYSKFSSRKIDVEFSPKDVWHLDKNWKINLFGVDFLDIAAK